MARRYDVMLSHTGADREIALSLHRELESGHGLRVWLYEQNTEPGAFRTGVQEDLLQSGASFVVIVSEQAAMSKEVRHEASRAFALDRARIPVYVNEMVVRDERVKGQLHVDAQNGVVLEAKNGWSEAAARVAAIVHADLRGRGDEGSLRLPDGRLVVGRQHLVSELVEEIQGRNARALVLHGPPGAGKTTVARAVISALAESGLAVAMASLTRNDRTYKEILSRIQNDLQLEADAGAGEQIIVHALGARVRAKGGLVLLIDNFEQVSPAARDELLRDIAPMHAPPFTLIITTRQCFGTTTVSASEHNIEPLDVPPAERIARTSAGRLCADYPSVSLFLEHAISPVHGHEEMERARNKDRRVIQDIARLCAGHHGFPGAIEVAAKTFRRYGGLATLLTRMGEHRKLRLDGAETMAVAVRTTCDLLAPVERTAFLRCAGFEGGFDDEAAEALLSASNETVRSILQALADCGLLRHEAKTQRWSMYLPVMECAREMLAEQGEAPGQQTFAGEHSRYFLELATRLRSPMSDESRALFRRRLDADRDNIVLALTRTLEARRIDDAGMLLLATEDSFRARGPASTLLALAHDIDSAMDETVGGPHALHAEINLAAARAAHSLGRYAESLQRAAECYERAGAASPAFKLRAINAYMEAAGTTGAPGLVERLSAEVVAYMDSDAKKSVEDVCVSLIEMTYVQERTDGFELAMQTLKRAQQLGIDNPDVKSDTRWRLLAAEGLLLWRNGATGAAISCFQESIHLVENLKLGDKFFGGSQTNIALARVDTNEYNAAMEACRLGQEALRAARDDGWLSVAFVAEAATRLYARLGPDGDTVAARERAGADALEYIERHEQAVRRIGYCQNMALLLSVKGEALAWQGRLHDAEPVLLEARKWCREQAGIPTFERWFRVCVLLAKIAISRCDRAAAAPYLAGAAEFVQKRMMSRRVFPVYRTATLYEEYTQICAQLGIKH